MHRNSNRSPPKNGARGYRLADAPYVEGERATAICPHEHLRRWPRPAFIGLASPEWSRHACDNHVHLMLDIV